MESLLLAASIGAAPDGARVEAEAISMTRLGRNAFAKGGWPARLRSNGDYGPTSALSAIGRK